jgi:hypothetical protein
MSLKIEAYMDLAKQQDGSLGGVGQTEAEKKAAAAPKILHREEKKNKPEPGTTKANPYMARDIGWVPVPAT